MGGHDDSRMDDWVKVAQMGKGIFETLKQNRDEADFNTYVAEMGKNPDFAPDYNDPSFNAKAFSKARADYTGRLLQDENVKKVRYETWKNDIDKKMVAANEIFAKALAFTNEDNLEQGLPLFEKAFEQVNTGTDIEIGKDGKSFVEINNITGERIPHEFKSTRDMISSFQTYAEGLKDPKAFARNHIMTAEEIARKNIDAVSKAEEVFDSKGRRALLIKGMLDPDTGKPRGDMIDLGGENYVPANSEAGLKFRTRASTSAELKEEETRASTAEKYAGAEYHRKAGEAALTKAGAERKGSDAQKIAAYKEAYGLKSDAEALDIIRSDNMNKELMSQLDKWVTDNNIELSDKKDYEAYLKKRDELINTGAVIMDRSKKAGSGVNKPKAQPRPGQGVRDAKPGESKGVDLNRVISELDKNYGNLKDGSTKYLGNTKYIKVNGKWTLGK